MKRHWTILGCYVEADDAHVCTWMLDGHCWVYDPARAGRNLACDAHLAAAPWLAHVPDVSAAVAYSLGFARGRTQ
jgi:hypothetical protein